MTWGMIGGAAVSVVGGSLLSGGGGGGGGTSGGNAPPVYIPKNQQGVDTNFLNSKDLYQDTLQYQQNQTSPYNNQLFQSQYNNPYAYGMQANANNAGNQLQSNAQQQQGQTQQTWDYAQQQLANANNQQNMLQANLPQVQQSSANLYNMANQSNANYQNLLNYQTGQQGNVSTSQNNLYGAGNQVLQTSQDPQNALYNRTQQQLTDQSRAAQYARGIQSSPYGAALENSANQNFNIDWQNQQLARQAAGLQAAQGAYGSAQGLGNTYVNNVAGLQAGKNEQYAGLTNAGQNQFTGYINAMNQSNAANTQNIGAAQAVAGGLGAQAAQSYYGAGQLPYQSSQQIFGNQNQAIQNYQGNNQSYLSGLNQLQSNDLGYMNFGQSAQNVGFNQNAYNNQQTQNAIGQIAGPASKFLGSTDWGGLFGDNAVGNSLFSAFGGLGGSL